MLWFRVGSSHCWSGVLFIMGRQVVSGIVSSGVSCVHSILLLTYDFYIQVRFYLISGMSVLAAAMVL